MFVGAIVLEYKQIEGKDAALFGESGLHASVDARAGTADEMLLLAAYAHHNRGVRFPGKDGRNDQGNGGRALAAESAAGIFADEDDLVGIDTQPP